MQGRWVVVGLEGVEVEASQEAMGAVEEEEVEAANRERETGSVRTRESGLEYLYICTHCTVFTVHNP